jgi:undecaprenyl-diphosphatase
MTHLGAIILGLIEGFTEFIPVSSSGHLIIAREVLNIKDVQALSFDAVIQMSATLALILYFYKDVLKLVQNFFKLIFRKNILEKEKTLLYAIILGTIPAVFFGFLLEKEMESAFRSAHLVSLALLFGAWLMWYAQRQAKENKSLDIKNGILVGLYQCLALVPGVSRSGATISGGLLSGLSKEEAIRFSFLLSIPILLGSGLKKLFEVRGELLGNSFGSLLLLGSLTAFLAGYLSIRFLMKYLKNNDLNIFIYYRIALFIAIFFLF